MHTGITIFADDLVNPKLTHVPSRDGRWQVECVSDYHGMPTTLTAYMSAADARHIAEAWLRVAIAIDRREREACDADDTDPSTSEVQP